MKFLSPQIYLFIFLGFSTLIQAQDGVGINTENPRTTLEVAGDTHISGSIQVGDLGTTTASDTPALLGQDGTGFVKELSTAAAGAAVAYFQEYRFTNMGGGGDWIQDLNTSIDASNYTLTIISVYYNKPLRISSSANFAIPYASAFTKGGTWHITADYASASGVSPSPVGEWVINTLILSNDFSKQFPQQSVPMGGGRGGAATTPVIN
jgi:hypothetical protein